MAGVDFLAALGGGLSAGGQYLSYERDKQRDAEEEEKRRRFQRELVELNLLGDERNRIAGHENRMAEITESDRLATNRRTIDRALEGADKQIAVMAKDIEKQEAGKRFESFLGTSGLAPDVQSRLRTMRGAADVGIDLSYDDLTPPVTKPSVEDDAYQRTRGTLRAQREFPDETKPLADDPLFPYGVNQYFGTLPGRYAERAGAEDEINRAMPDLLKAHPRLSRKRVDEWLEAAYGPRPKPGDVLQQLAPPRAPVPAPPATVNAGRATAAGPMGGRSTGAGPGPAAAAPAPAAAPALQVGQVVTKKDGTRWRVTAVFPNGTWDGEPVGR